MVPSYFVRLEKVKLTPNGKIDRGALPSPDEAVPVSGEEYAAPGNEIEEKLVETWKSVLGREVIGITDDFFMIGGDSIKSIQVISRMRKAGYKVEMRDIFRYPTIARLAPQVKRTECFADQAAVIGTVPLTPIQEAFFLETPIDPHHYNQAVMLYSPQGFEVEAIEAVFTGIQAHHDALRMTFREEEGKIIQVNRGTEHPLSLEVFHLQNHDHVDAVGILETRANELQASIDMEKGPLMKLGLFRLDDGDRLLIIIHHLVVDGVSWRILLEDMNNLYPRYREHRQIKKLKLPPKTGSFKLWSEKLSEYADSKAFLKEKTYWRELESLEVPGIKKDFAVEDNDVKDAETLSFDLTEGETGNLLTGANRAFGTEINDILLTALGMAVRGVFGIEKPAIALEGHGRENILADMDVTRTMGWFTSIYPVVLDFSCYSRPGDMARQIKVRESVTVF
jgi:aryl carrier-like protein